MKIYLDVILIINFTFDFILLLGTSLILKRNIKIKKVILGSLIGSLSTLTLFFKINSLELFILKIIISIIMILITFQYISLKYTIKNIIYLYITSIFLGGCLYMLNCSFAYKQIGLIFYHKNFSINIIVAIIITPLIIYLYVKQTLNYKNKYTYYYNVIIYLKNKTKLKLTGYLDTGNKLKDPYLNRPIVIINKNIIKTSDYIDNYIMVPVRTICGKNILKCIEINKLVIEGVCETKNVLLGISEENIKIEGIDCLLQTRIMEEI